MRYSKSSFGISISMDLLLASAVNMISVYRINSALENGTRPALMNDPFTFRPQFQSLLGKSFSQIKAIQDITSFVERMDPKKQR